MFEHCSYPASNLGDFSDFLNPGGVPVWQQLGFASKAAWKQAGAPSEGATVGTPVFVPPPRLPAVGTGGTTGSGASTVPIAPDSGGALAPVAEEPASGGFLSGIPSSWLLIGGAIALLMMMKK